MRTLVAALLFASLAGCSGADEPTPAAPIETGPSGSISTSGTPTAAPGASTSTAAAPVPTAPSTASSSSSPSPSSTSAPPASNRDPTAGLTASSATGGDVTLQATGSDPDGDALTWVLSFGDGSADALGDGLLASLLHSYAPGSYTATLTVLDGRGGQASATATVTVLAPYSLAVELSVTAACAGCATDLGTSISVASGTPGLDAQWIELPTEAAGKPFAVSASSGDPSVAFTAACEAGADVLLVVAESGAEAGTVPAAGCLYVWKDGLLGATFTITIG